MDRKAIGARLRKLREDAGYVQWALADILHTSQKAVSSWEIGKVTPTLDTIMLYCKHFKVSADWILFGEEGK